MANRYIKILSIINHQRKTNQNQNEIIPSHLLERLLSKHTRNNKYWQERAKENPVYYWWEFQGVQWLWQIVWKFLKKLKKELPYDSAITLWVPLW